MGYHIKIFRNTKIVLSNGQNILISAPFDNIYDFLYDVLTGHGITNENVNSSMVESQLLYRADAVFVIAMVGYVEMQILRDAISAGAFLNQLQNI